MSSKRELTKQPVAYPYIGLLQLVSQNWELNVY